jgi:hypothetical protein
LDDSFDAARVLGATAQRPWPMARGPWIMTQTWNDLLFAHWPLSAAAVRARVPAGLELDLFEGQAWLGIVPFHMTNVAPRAVPALPWLSAFPELNVRTYVRVGDKPGVYFFSLDAARSLAVIAARVLLNLPYHTASMQVRLSDAVDYESRRLRAAPGRGEFLARYRAAGPAYRAATESLDYFLTERYCLYAAGRRGRLYRLEIHHPPWDLQPASAEIARNTMADVAGLSLPHAAPLLHFSKRQNMICWMPQSLNQSVDS